MAARYERGSVRIIGKRDKKWQGIYHVYVADQSGTAVRRQRSVILGAASKLSKRQAEAALAEIVTKELGVATGTIRNDSRITFEDFYTNRYLPMQSHWRDSSANSTKYIFDKYIVPHFGSMPLDSIDKLTIQLYLNKFAAKGFSYEMVKKVRMWTGALLEEAVAQEYITKNHQRFTHIPDAVTKEKAVMTAEMMFKLIDAVTDVRDQALLCIGVFCALRPSEAFGLLWESWCGDSFRITRIAWKGKIYDRVKTRTAKRPVAIPERIRQYIQEWHDASPNHAPEALMFPAMKVGGAIPVQKPMLPDNWLRLRIYPVADRLGFDFHPCFQVMRRSLATVGSEEGSMKAVQGQLGHSNIGTTADIYVQPVDESVKQMVNAVAEKVFAVGAGAGSTVKTTGRPRLVRVK